jgi:hypothetical protein
MGPPRTEQETEMTIKTLAAAALTVLVALPVLPAFAQVAPTNYPPKRENPKPVTTTSSCGSELGFLRRVSQGEVMGIDNYERVWVTEICPGSELGMMRNEGNAGKLRQAIASNDVIMQRLDEMAYTEQDVIAIKMMGEDTIHLYVYHYQR